MVFFCFFSGSNFLKAQCYSGNKAFGPGEKISYEAYYNWGPIWVNAGKIIFSVESGTHLGKSCWHLKSSGKTYPSYDIFFKVADYYDSWIDPENFTSYGFQRYINEGDYKLVNTIRFDHPKELVFSNTKTNNNPVRYDTLHPGKCVFDMLTSVYLTRTLDLGSIKPEVKVPIHVIIDDSVYSIYIRSLGKEIVTDRKGQKYRCIKFAAKMVQGTIFRGDEDALIWVTDDENKIPVYIEAKIIIGTVKAYLIGMEGMRNPVKALIK
ncbi:MAG: DUF3108 domain-containing protein [Bacteroidota bacterium]|nr:DUF3108 domain-containing protein [Bacteroidota bacterium]